MEISVDERDLEYILDALEAVREDHKEFYQTMLWDYEEPTRLNAIIAMLRGILGLEEEDEYDEEAQQESLELRFDE